MIISCSALARRPLADDNELELSVARMAKVGICEFAKFLARRISNRICDKHQWTATSLDHADRRRLPFAGYFFR
jgi:hypothetical protein